MGTPADVGKGTWKRLSASDQASSSLAYETPYDESVPTAGRIWLRARWHSSLQPERTRNLLLRRTSLRKRLATALASHEHEPRDGMRENLLRSQTRATHLCTVDITCRQRAKPGPTVTPTAVRSLKSIPARERASSVVLLMAEA